MSLALDVKVFFLALYFRYCAPEYAENGIASVQTDVYSYGIVLIQLISGRKAVDSKRADQQPSLRQWVCSGNKFASYSCRN